MDPPEINPLETGSLELITGPMLSGKTSELLRRLLIDKAIGFKVLYINHSSDTRSKGPFSTHNPLYRDHADISFLSVDTLEDASENIKTFDIIGIDEAQFFKDLARVVPGWVEVNNKKVIVAGLTGDFRRKKFGHLLDLEPLADKFTRLSSFCSPCAKTKTIRRAIFTHRKHESTGRIFVGGEDIYTPVCRECFLKLN